MKKKKRKHLTLDDRIEIQECLSKGMTFKAIGNRINKKMALFRIFCKRAMCDEIRDFKIPEPEATFSASL